VVVEVEVEVDESEVDEDMEVEVEGDEDMEVEVEVEVTDGASARLGMLLPPPLLLLGDAGATSLDADVPVDIVVWARELVCVLCVGEWVSVFGCLFVCGVCGGCEKGEKQSRVRY
jgi:2-methylaconitate cis-trans-isomerase PrpF